MNIIRRFWNFSKVALATMVVFYLSASEGQQVDPEQVTMILSDGYLVMNAEPSFTTEVRTTQEMLNPKSFPLGKNELQVRTMPTFRVFTGSIEGMSLEDILHEYFKWEFRYLSENIYGKDVKVQTEKQYHGEGKGKEYLEWFIDTERQDLPAILYQTRLQGDYFVVFVGVLYDRDDRESVQQGLAHMENSYQVYQSREEVINALMERSLQEQRARSQ